jgi:hypothetical protein
MASSIHFSNPMSSHNILDVRERTLFPGKGNTRTFGTCLNSGGVNKHTCIHQLLIEFAQERGEKRNARFPAIRPCK